EQNKRAITAFTYNAGYTGMVDSLWTLGKRLKIRGIHNPFEPILQSVEEEHLYKAKESFEHAAHKIITRGTPKKLPPMIVCFLGRGKTAKGAREMFDLLPHEDITIDRLQDVFENGSRNKLYALHISRDTIFRLNKNALHLKEKYDALTPGEKRSFYGKNPRYFESNLDKVLPYITVLMNCITWSPEYPRTITKSMMNSIYKNFQTLQVIGDITCDPNGSIEFSKEMWIDDPVFIYNPLTGNIKDGFEGKGIAVMAVTNLPCEFSADASTQFSENIYPFLKNIVSADYKSTIDESGLMPDIRRAVILWKGQFTERYKYMNDYLTQLAT
ncbi:MAG TPA: hypothetical protein ENH47_00995, partial [Ignavibacteriales bacterium]|nr:hypothetical protein [Ignavibacteriales bacterium]